MMVFIKISGIDAKDLPKGFEGQRADKSDEEEGMEDEGQDENRHRYIISIYCLYTRFYDFKLKTSSNFSLVFY